MIDNLLFLSVRLEKRKTKNFLMNQTLMMRKKKKSKKKRDEVVFNNQLQITQALFFAHFTAYQVHGKQ